MADKKISQLSDASLPLAGTEVLPIVQSSATVKVAANDLTVKNIRSNATTGLLQIVGPASAATRVMTVPDANFTAARIDAAQSFTGDQTLSTGNLVIGTAGKGIDFSAVASAAGMTSELLNDYEEGTWTPSGNGISYTVNAAVYTKTGRFVFCSFDIVFPNTSGDGAAARISMPFTPSVGILTTAFTTSAYLVTGVPSGSNMNLYYKGGSPETAYLNSDLSTRRLIGSAIFSVA